MLQRKQTIFMFIALLMAVLMLLSPIVAVEKDGLHTLYGNGTITSNLVSVTTIFFNLIPITLGILISLISVAIGFFKKRNVQVLFNRLSISIWLVVICIVLIKLDTIEKLLGILVFKIEIGSIAPLVAIFMHTYAIRFIKKDINLIKSQDRIR